MWRSWGIGGEEGWAGGCTSGVLGADKSLLGGREARRDGRDGRGRLAGGRDVGWKRCIIRVDLMSACLAYMECDVNE